MTQLQLLLLIFPIGILTLIPASNTKLGEQDKATMDKSQIPVATQWVLDAAGEDQREAIKSVLMLVCPKTGSKGTAFLLKSGLIVTNEHVIRECVAEELVGFSGLGNQVKFSKMVADPDRDLALLRPSTPLKGGLKLASEGDPPVGTLVSTWGFPLGYNGPAPLLSVGYLSGYRENRESGTPVKHLVVNGAFNAGNSGGPLFRANSDQVIGIVVMT